MLLEWPLFGCANDFPFHFHRIAIDTFRLFRLCSKHISSLKSNYFTLFPSLSLSISLSCAHFGMNKLVIRLFYDCSTTCSITHFSLSTKWCITSDLWTWWLRHNTMPLWHYKATPASSSVKWCWALSFYRFKFICVDFVGKLWFIRCDMNTPLMGVTDSSTAIMVFN